MLGIIRAQSPPPLASPEPKPQTSPPPPTDYDLRWGLKIPLRDATVRAEGDLDFRGTLAVSKEVPVGFQQIRLRFELDSDATEEQLATLLRLTERYCVVYQTLTRPPKIDISHRVSK